MKNTIWIALGLFSMVACSDNDDEITETTDPTVKLTYEESVDGDLSSLFNTPTSIMLVEGDNMIKSDQQGEPRDVDYFTFTVPEGFLLSELQVAGYNAEPENKAFIGIATGTEFPSDMDNTAPSNLLGGYTYGAGDLGSDILIPAGTLDGATGFTAPLPSGSYTIWLNQTGPKSEVQLNLVLAKSN